MTHWISVSEEWNATARRSIATLTTVTSRIDMTAPSITTPATISVARSSSSGSLLADADGVEAAMRADGSGPTGPFTGSICGRTSEVFTQGHYDDDRERLPGR